VSEPLGHVGPGANPSGAATPRLLGFPRGAPRMFAASASLLAIGIHHYGFTRSVTRAQQRLVAQTVRIPALRRAFAQEGPTRAPHCGWDRWQSMTREVTARATGAIHFWPQWEKLRLGYLLLSGSTPVEFVVAEPEGSRAFHPTRSTMDSGVVPQLLDEEIVDGWSVRHHRPLPAFHQPMAWDVPRLRRIAGEVSRLLVDQLPAPAMTPEDWEPAHGDFVPWNIRRAPNGQIWLTDWEDACWAPPFTDEVRFASAHLSLRREPTDALTRRLVADLGHPPDILREASGFLLSHRNTHLSHLDRPPDPQLRRARAEVRLLRAVHRQCGGTA
jgi:hypothetical protein